MPYPNEHSARLLSPNIKKERVRRTKGSGDAKVQGVKIPTTISVIWFIVKKEGKEIPRAQALRFPTKTWTEQKAKNWLKKNKIKYILFEPATKKPKSMKHINIRAEKNKAEIDIFGSIGQSIFEEGHTLESVKAELKKIQAKELVINIASLGGSAFEGLAIHDLLASQKADKTVNIVGATASAGAIISQVEDAKINISENALLLVHNCRGVAMGEAKDIEAFASEMKKIDARMLNVLMNRAKKEEKEVSDLMAEDRFMDAEEAKEYGFVDEVVKPVDLAASKLNLKNLTETEELSEANIAALKVFYADEEEEEEETTEETEEEKKEETETEEETTEDTEETTEEETEEEEKPEAKKPTLKERLANAYDAFINKNKDGEKNTNPKSDNGAVMDEDLAKINAKLMEENKVNKAKMEKMEAELSKLNQKASKETKVEGDDPEVHKGKDTRPEYIQNADKNAESLKELEI